MQMDRRTWANPEHQARHRSQAVRGLVILAVTVLCVGLLAQATTVGMPKIFAVRAPGVVDWAGLIGAGGLASVALAIGALQMMLDRGESQDWFASREIVIEAALAALGMYLFIVHIFTHRKPFIEPAMFRDRNFSVGLLFIFIVGIILLATMALLPPFMQNL